MPIAPANASPATNSATNSEANSCPDLQPYYPDANVNWFFLERELSRLMPYCLDSAEFFALYGAAQLNTGQVSAAVESLERALLTDPDHGGARIDYAEALLLQGQVFPALDLNRQLLARNDLPPELASMLRERQREWRQRTRQRGAEVELLAGYDSNLNRGPSSDRITVTLAGEPIELVLGEDFRPVRGAYGQLRAAGYYSRLQPGHSHNWMAEISSRLSEDSASDINQFNGRYAWQNPRRDHNWQLGAALTHLGLGGTSLFSAAELNMQYQRDEGRRCEPFYGLVAQHQLYHHSGNNLDAVEARSTGGMICENGSSAWQADLSLLNSISLSNNRPGGDRVGWQARLRWQHDLPGALIRAELAHTRLQDHEAYSDLLQDGARRHMHRSVLLLQYRRPLPIVGGTLLLNAYHQRQGSNIVLFSSNDSAVEAGLRFNF